MKKNVLIFLIILLVLASFGCKREEKEKTVVHLWHQMEPEKRPVLKQVIEEFEENNPDIEVVVLAKGTEELRTGYQAAAAFTGGGPELVYGPMDQIGPFEVMKQKNSDISIIMPMEDLYPEEFYHKFVDQGLVRYKGHIYQIADRLGNHLALVYNKKLFDEAGISDPPQTIEEFLQFGQKLTKDTNNDGTIDQWGLVWNYTEPFWFVPFFGGYGGEVFDEDNNPELDSPAAEKAFQLILDMRNKYKIMPPECDYDIADNMFNQGNAAMIINGDWSWNKYIASPHVDFGLARIPYVEETQEWCKPMVSATGYSVNGSAKGEVLEATKLLLKYLTSEEVQLQFVEKFKSIPSLKSLQERPAIANDPVMKISAEQIEVGQLMPIIPEMRAAWDAMRPALQSVISGNMSPKKAAEYQQELCVQKIAEMYEGSDESAEETTLASTIFFVLGIALGLYLTYVLVFKFILALMRKPNSFETKNARFAVFMALPASVILFGVVIYPFFYNIVLSFSNMNMTNVNSWTIIGFGQYLQVFAEKIFYSVFFKTVVWTVVNVFFHVTIGVFLAVLLNRYLPGKAIIRVLLILPWAVPEYITALTWRGMFMYDTGAINLILHKLGIPAVNWLSEATTAFIASMITNIWLGVPFMMIIALGGLQSIPKELYEAAEIDGASAWKRFWKVTVPLLKPVMIPAITLGIVWTFNKLTVIWLVTNGGQPADKSHILVSYVYRAAFNLYRYGYAAAFSMVIFLILVIFSVTFMKRSNVAEKA
ncbi:MAG: extracellular solute-binding protein [Candidatus Cloacimonetes bacterium]|nr:extracellular solute-binding protein [Candidatus Cloacimonadota bacterium]